LGRKTKKTEQRWIDCSTENELSRDSLDWRGVLWLTFDYDVFEFLRCVNCLYIFGEFINDLWFLSDVISERILHTCQKTINLDYTKKAETSLDDSW
jgi:hypothetical protein